MFIKNLKINKFKWIENLELSFSKNLNVISGSSGTGKSLILSTFKLLLGSSLEKGESLEFEIVFEDNNNPFGEREIFISIENKNGKTSYYINAKKTTSKTLKEFFEDKIFFQNQFDIRKLNLLNWRLAILETSEIKNKLSEFHKIYREFEKKCKSSKKDLFSLKKEVEKKIEIFEELKKLNLKENETIILEEELTNLEKLESQIQTVKNLKNWFEYEFLEKLNLLKTLNINEELVFKFEEIAENIIEKLNEKDIENISEKKKEIENRLSQIWQAERKFSKWGNQLFEYFQQLKIDIENLKEEIEFVKNQEVICNKLKQELENSANKISSLRKKQAEKLTLEIKKILHNLFSEDIFFKITIEKKQLDITGFDKVQILFSAIKQNPPQDISKIASGGELNRILFAITSLLSQEKLLIIDEPETGLDENSLKNLANFIKKISNKNQLIIVTHSKLIKSIADKTILLSKETLTNKTMLKLKYE